MPTDTPTLSPFPTLRLAHRLRGNSIGAEGATALAAILKETQITNLECAAAPECLLFCQCPLTRLLSHHPHPTPHSLGDNKIGDQGASALAAILKETKITTAGLKCAAAPECSLSCQRPLTCLLPSYHLRPSPHPHTSVLAPFLSFPPCFLHPFHMLIRVIYCPRSCAPRGPRPRPPVGRVHPHARSRIHPPHPLATSPVAACGTTTSTARPNKLSKTPRAAASASRSSTQLRRTPAPDSTRDSPAPAPPSQATQELDGTLRLCTGPSWVGSREWL